MREDIETVIDRLLDYVRSNGRVHVKDAAAALALSASQVEKIGLMLEQSKLLEVRYTLRGVYLEAMEEEKEGKTGKGAPDGSLPRSPHAGEGTSPVMQEIQRLEREVLTSENLLHFFQQDIQRRLLLTQSIIDDLEKKPGFTEEEIEAARKEIGLARQQLESFDTEIGKLTASQKHLQKRLDDFSQRLSKLQPIAASTAFSHDQSFPRGISLKRLRDIIRGIISRIQLILSSIAPSRQSSRLLFSPSARPHVLRRIPRVPARRPLRFTRMPMAVVAVSRTRKQKAGRKEGKP